MCGQTTSVTDRPGKRETMERERDGHSRFQPPRTTQKCLPKCLELTSKKRMALIYYSSILPVKLRSKRPRSKIAVTDRERNPRIDEPASLSKSSKAVYDRIAVCGLTGNPSSDAPAESSPNGHCGQSWASLRVMPIRLLGSNRYYSWVIKPSESTWIRGI